MSFGGEAQYSSYWDWESQCGNPSTDKRDPALPSRPENCPTSPSPDGKVKPAFGDFLLGSNDDSYGIAPGATPDASLQCRPTFSAACCS